MDKETVEAWIARCPFCPASAIWDSGYHFVEGVVEKLYLLHLQVKHPTRYAKLVKHRAKVSDE